MVQSLWSSSFSDFEPDTGLRGKRAKTHPKSQLRVLILDLYVAWLQDPGMSIGVAMTNGAYQPNSRYNALHISKVMIPLVHRARQVGLIGLVPGSEFAGRTTRIWAEKPLVELFRGAKFGLLDRQ